MQRGENNHEDSKGSQRTSAAYRGYSVASAWARYGTVPFGTSEVLAASILIRDEAHVLNVSQVQRAASQLPHPVNIFTTSMFDGSKSEFAHSVECAVTSPTTIAIGRSTPPDFGSFDAGGADFGGSGDFASSSDW